MGNVLATSSNRWATSKVRAIRVTFGTSRASLTLELEGSRTRSASRRNWWAGSDGAVAAFRTIEASSVANNKQNFTGNVLAVSSHWWAFLDWASSFTFRARSTIQMSIDNNESFTALEAVFRQWLASRSGTNVIATRTSGTVLTRRSNKSSRNDELTTRRHRSAFRNWARNVVTSRTSLAGD